MPLRQRSRRCWTEHCIDEGQDALRAKPRQDRLARPASRSGGDSQPPCEQHHTLSSIPFFSAVWSAAINRTQHEQAMTGSLPTIVAAIVTAAREAATDIEYASTEENLTPERPVRSKHCPITSMPPPFRQRKMTWRRPGSCATCWVWKNC